MLPTASSSAPFKPIMNEPESYHDVHCGIGETKANVDSVMCGGWDPASRVMIEYDPDINPPCKVQINCQGGMNSCNGTTGFCDLKLPDGTINICMSLADPGSHGTEYLLLHELTHAKQICPTEPGQSPGDCCNMETEAYLVMCSAMEADGIFATQAMIDAGMTMQKCVEYGVDMVSCAGMPTPCYGTPGLASLGPAYMAAFAMNFNGTCQDLKDNPTPRVQALLDEIEDMSNSMQHLYVLKCEDGSQDCIPVPDISPDLPGRQNDEPIGDSKTGIGLRGSYEFPDTTQGYMSACNIYDTKYFDKDLQDRGIAYGLEDDDDDRDPNTGKPLTEPGDVEVNQEQLCIRYANATPHQCEKLYERFRTLSNGAPRPVMSCHTKDVDEGDVDGDGDDDGDDDLHYAFNFVKTYCFDYNDEGTRPPLTLDFLNVTLLLGIESMVPTQWMPPELSKKCFGQECRTPFLPEFEDKFPENCDYDDTTGQMYHSHTQRAIISSYYRHYSGPLLYNLGVTIKEVKHGDDIQDWKVRGECYEYYDIDQGGTWNGEDWKPLVSTLFDEKCELIIGTKSCTSGRCTETDPHQQEPLQPEWRDGNHLPDNPNTQKENYMPEVGLDEPERGGRTAPDAWLYDDESVLTMLDNKRVQEVQRLFEDPSDPSGFLDAMLESKVRGGKTVPDNARTDGFDDTDDRELTIWWEKQQKELLELIRDPTIKLIMPPRVLTGLATDDPLIELASGMVSQPDGTVAITLKAGPEELGAVTKSFQQMYVAPIREVRIPILTLLASRTELKTRRAEWELWKLRNPNIASQADPLIDKIDEYLEDLERVRLMRLALAGRLQKMYETQEDIREFYGEWYEGNSQLILDAAQASIERQRLKTIWRKLQKAWLQTDACQILWCSNHRYSAPVYTLLDNWWRQKVMPGDAPPGRDRDGLPEPPTLEGLAPDTPDKSYDFSFMGLSQEEWRVPVLWPVSVRVQIPLPPTYKGSEPLGPDEYPELPDYPDKTAFDSLPVLTASFPDQTFIDAVPLPDLQEAKKRLMLMREMIEGITVKDQETEEQEEQAGNSSAESDTDSFPMFRDSMRGAYCRLDPSVLMPPSKEEDIAIDEDYGNAIKIIHTETDLVERAGRIWSRWMPQRKEDYAGRIIRVGEQFPNPDNPPPCKEDVVCIPMPDEIFKSWKWQWFVPPLDGDFRSIADQMRDLTLPDDETENPFIDADVELLKRLFPKIDVPNDILLEPDPPAAP